MRTLGLIYRSFAVALLALTVSLPAAAKDTIYQAERTGPQEPVTVEAEVIEGGDGPDGTFRVHASGSVTVTQGMKHLTGDEFIYNGSAGVGLLKNASFTTCDKPNPDFRITAQEIRLRPDQRVSLRRARVYIGRIRVISLPRLTVNVGGGGGGASFMPRPGYNKRDGLFLSSRMPLFNTGDNAGDLRVRLTAQRGIQGGVTGGHALIGNALATPPYVPDTDTELRRTSILQPDVEDQGSVCIFRGTTAEPRLVSLFGALLTRDQVSDIDVHGLLVSRLPEVGLRAISRRASIPGTEEIPDIGIQGQVRTSFGRFKENYRSEAWANRWDVRGTGSTDLATLGNKVAVRAAGLARYSSYSTGTDYSVLAASVDVSRIFESGSFGSLRLIHHWTNGTTPFEFDDIDIKSELQGALRYVHGRDTFTTLLDYDLDRNRFRGWQFSWAHKTDCLEPVIGINNTLRQVSLNVRVLGL